MKVPIMTVLRWICGLIRLDRNMNTYVKESLGITNIDGKIEENRLRWLECVE